MMSGPTAAEATQIVNHRFPSAMWRLTFVGGLVSALTIAAPLSLKSFGDNAFIAFTIASGLFVIAAMRLSDKAAGARALWLIIIVGVGLRLVALSFEPLLSTDIYRYIWDGKVQTAGINPYRYVPADPALAMLRDPQIFPNINRADYAVTIYPPVAQAFFLVVGQAGANTFVMRLALLICEAASVAFILLLLKRLTRPLTRVVAYLWHPLPVWEIANSGHIDALMLCLLLAGVWLAFTKRNALGAVTVALAVLVKPFAAAALAVIWRPWNWKMVAAAIAAVAICYLPYLSVGWGVFGFLTNGYVAEEAIASGGGFWLLWLWRLLFGTHWLDVPIYVALAALLMLSIVLCAWRRPMQGSELDMTAINAALLAGLVLLSPNYPWYFLAVTPFLAFRPNAPTWAASIGALLLTNETPGHDHLPLMIAKSIQLTAVLICVVWVVAQKYRGRSQPRQLNGDRA